MLINEGAYDFSAEELEALFNTGEQDTPTATSENVSEQLTNDEPKANTSIESSVETTKAFAKRLSERTSKAIAEEREAIAQKLGYSSYDDMMRTSETRRLEDNGLDPEIATPVIDQIVQERIKNMPEMRELSELRELKVKEYGKQQLSEITKLTNGEITKLEQLPKEVVELWKQTGDLKKAYLQLEGEKLILSARRAQSQGSTTHMATPSAATSAIASDKRLLTEEEKRVWKQFNPNMTQDELNKVTVPKKY